LKGWRKKSGFLPYVLQGGGKLGHRSPAGYPRRERKGVSLNGLIVLWMGISGSKKTKEIRKGKDRGGGSPTQIPHIEALRPVWKKKPKKTEKLT